MTRVNLGSSRWMELSMAHSSDSGVGNSNTAPAEQGQPDAWTLVREGFIQPIFSLQKHMPEISVGRSTECMLNCAGR